MLPHRLLETVHHNLTASRAEYWSVTASRISHESIQWWSLAFYCSEWYLPSTLFPPTLKDWAQGRVTIRASNRGLPSWFYWMRTKLQLVLLSDGMPGCSLLSAFHSVAGGCQQLNLGAVQNQASFKATCVCICDILWQFSSFFKSMRVMVGNRRGAKSAWCLVFATVSKFHKTSIWGKASICTYDFSLKGAGPKFGQDEGMMRASEIWPTTLTPHISGRQQLKGLTICISFL